MVVGPLEEDTIRYNSILLLKTHQKVGSLWEVWTRNPVHISSSSLGPRVPSIQKHRRPNGESPRATANVDYRDSTPQVMCYLASPSQGPVLLAS